MKRILITGANSYIGTSFETWLKKSPEKYYIETMDMTNDVWKDKSFSRYDVIFHVAGIAHISNNRKIRHLYDQVNRDLAVETAKKAKRDGVKQFIFMSSIIVYGGSVKKQGIITERTIPLSNCPYGNSKLQAENIINELNDNTFKTVIIRAPMVYGKNSKGNYKRLSRLARTIPIFPYYENQRSMIHIDNLCEFIRLMIDNKEQGIFFPQNKQYVCTCEMVKKISEMHNKKIYFTKIFNPIIKLLIPRVNILNKVFGNLMYEHSMSDYKDNYQVRDFAESLILSEQ